MEFNAGDKVELVEENEFTKKKGLILGDVGTMVDALWTKWERTNQELCNNKDCLELVSKPKPIVEEIQNYGARVQIAPTKVIYNGITTILLYKVPYRDKPKKCIVKCGDGDFYSKQAGKQIAILKAIARESQREINQLCKRSEEIAKIDSKIIEMLEKKHKSVLLSGIGKWLVLG